MTCKEVCLDLECRGRSSTSSPGSLVCGTGRAGQAAGDCFQSGPN